MDSIETILERLAPELAVLEERRKHALDQRGHAWAISLITGLVAVTLALTFGRDWLPASFLFAAIGSVVVGTIVHLFVAAPAFRAFTAGFKADLVRELVRGMEPGLDYHPEAGIPQESFQATQLFSTRPDRYRTEDLLTGTIGGCPVSLAEVHAEQRRSRTDSKGKRQTYYVTIFQGILMTAAFPKSFHGVTRILPDNEQTLFAGLGKAVQGFFPFGSKDLVRLEDPEFENHFRVYASDQVEARYLLSTSLMQRILDLRQLWGGCALRLSFVNSRIHLAIPSKSNFFEPNLQTSLEENSQFHRIAAEIRACLELVEHLNLQLRIWAQDPSAPK